MIKIYNNILFKVIIVVENSLKIGETTFLILVESSPSKEIDLAISLGIELGVDDPKIVLNISTNTKPPWELSLITILKCGGTLLSLSPLRGIKHGWWIVVFDLYFPIARKCNKTFIKVGCNFKMCKKTIKVGGSFSLGLFSQLVKNWDYH